jgi:hypothetical protein
MFSKLVGALALGLVVSGCSLRIQAPVREVAYDFSDRDFYDRAYAPSPTYAPAPQAQARPAAPIAPARAGADETGEGGTR